MDANTAAILAFSDTLVQVCSFLAGVFTAVGFSLAFTVKL